MESGTEDYRGRAIHAVLAGIDIAAEELKPEYIMRGYGDLPERAADDLHAFTGELLAWSEGSPEISPEIDWTSA
ncbi:MAG: hypothetical protein KO206_06040 [Methanomicrobiaceae archaeon]|uniref:Uncharacterized protein n=1 Tax=hydrocarbon metagenome TaxID=938273 RepID=A0A0W8FIJ3_9ZZZZ|nr:hypothetical protein [Methanomicrobiaceae archaeon]MDD5420042.1 hypothetical protein [Methanomicrobiaceae archaeon]